LEELVGEVDREPSEIALVDDPLLGKEDLLYGEIDPEVDPRDDDPVRILYDLLEMLQGVPIADLREDLDLLGLAGPDCLDEVVPGPLQIVLGVAAGDPYELDVLGQSLDVPLVQLLQYRPHHLPRLQDHPGAFEDLTGLEDHHSDLGVAVHRDHLAHELVLVDEDDVVGFDEHGQLLVVARDHLLGPEHLRVRRELEDIVLLEAQGPAIGEGEEPEVLASGVDHDSDGLLFVLGRGLDLLHQSQVLLCGPVG